MDAVAEVKARLSIEDVISEYVALKRAGRNFKGLSPFSNERTPSFVVSPDKQIWHDFSSGRGGDMFTFIEEVEGVDFKGALELLARKAGVDLEQFKTKGGQRGPDKNRLYALLDAAAKFYQVQFSANKDAYSYILKSRGYRKDTVLAFRLGYSPDPGRALMDYLLKTKFTQQEIKAAGLSTMRRGGPSDMFRGRIMVPLMDGFGKVIGFTARLLHDEPNAPKYINTPQTALYDKSRHVFGLHLAKQAIREQKFAVIVEGNMDVIASHQAGVTGVVATAGTALTEYQLKALSRLAPDVRLAFDQDRAGLAAAERAIPIASRVGVNLQMITIPSGKDPDDLIKQDPKLWEQAINKPGYAFDWLLARYHAQLDLTSAQGKREFSDVLLAVVRGLTDHVEQDHYLTKIAQASGVNIEALRAKLQQTNVAQPTRLKAIKEPPQKTDKATQDHKRAIDRLLSLTLTLAGTRNYLHMIKPDMLADEPQRQVLDFLTTHPDFDGKLPAAGALHATMDYVKILALQFEELYGTVDTLELQYEAARLRAQIIDLYVKTQKKIISASLKEAPDDHSLKQKDHELNILLKAIKKEP